VKGAHDRRTARTIVAAVGVLVLWPGIVMADPPAASFPPEFVAHLQQSTEIYIATVRKDGTRSHVVPVWFGFLDNAIWFTTDPKSYKGRRLKQGRPMFVSAQSKDGPFVKTRADIVNDPAMADRLGELYSQKYWIAWLGLFRPSRTRIESGKVVLVRLTPAS
jgi:hypothetical protein